MSGPILCQLLTYVTTITINILIIDKVITAHCPAISGSQFTANYALAVEHDQFNEEWA